MTMLTSDEAPLGDISSNVATTQWIADSGYITNTITTPITLEAGYIDTNTMIFTFTPDMQSDVNDYNDSRIISYIANISVPFGVSTVVFDARSTSGDGSNSVIFVHCTLAGGGTLSNTATFNMDVVFPQDATFGDNAQFLFLDANQNVIESFDSDPVTNPLIWISLETSGGVSHCKWIQCANSWMSS